MSFGNLLIHKVDIFEMKLGNIPGTKRKKMYKNQVDNDVPCRFNVLNGQTDANILGKLPKSTHKVFFEAGIVIKTNYKLVRKDTGDEFEINLIDKLDDADNAHHLEVIVKKKLK